MASDVKLEQGRERRANAKRWRTVDASSTEGPRSVRPRWKGSGDRLKTYLVLGDLAGRNDTVCVSACGHAGARVMRSEVQP